MSIMPTFLDVIRMELENMAPAVFFEPCILLGKTDSVKGIVEDEGLKKLFHHAIILEKAATEARIAATYTMSEEDRRLNSARTFELKIKSEIVMSLLLISIRDSFELWGESNIDLRKGWKVVVVRNVPLRADDLGQLFD